MRLRLSVLLFLFSLLFSANVHASSPPDGEPIRKDGSALYLHWCSQCHGLTGKGDGVNSTPDMAINPRDHTDRDFMQTRSDEQFEDVIRGGGTALAKSPLMPMWSNTLSNEEIKSLVVYLRELCKCEYKGIVSHAKLRRIEEGFK